MTLPIYPPAPDLPGLGYSVFWTPEFFNAPSAIAVSGASIDLALASTPLHTFELIYNFVRDGTPLPAGGHPAFYSNSEFKELMGFFLQMQGTPGRFLFSNPDDYFVTSQYVATANGTDRNYFPIQRRFGGGAHQFVGTEPVGYVDTSNTVNVYLDTGGGPVLKVYGVDYTIDQTMPCNQRIQFTNPPANGAVISIDCQYFYYCRLLDNKVTFEKYLNGIWRVQKVTIQSCRQGA